MKATLLLADGTVFQGNLKGNKESITGEVVFCTSMVGYQELITTPAYKGQLVVMTFPLIGNYGVNKEDVSSSDTHVKGIITRDITDFPNNFRCENTLDEYLVKNNIVALCGIDTRALTRILRDKGVMNGKIIAGDFDESKKEEYLKEINEYKIIDPVKEVSAKDIKKIECENSEGSVVVYDFGITNSIIESLKRRKLNVTLVPYNTKSEDVLALEPDGVLLSDGPGNPCDLADTAKEIKELLDKKVPMFGIELGHQIMALALGGKIEKLKYGHRGSSQPVKDLSSGRTYITSQNHGYCVSVTNDEEMIVSHININDDSVEGIIYKNYPAFSVQFHPETSEVNLDTAYLYDNFVDLMGGKENA